MVIDRSVQAYVFAPLHRPQDLATIRARLVAIAAPHPLPVVDMAGPGGASGRGMVLSVAEVPLVVMFVDAPFPASELAGPAAASALWPTALVDLADHRAHAVVATLSTPNDQLGALNAASAVGLLAAAVAELVDSPGLLYGPSQALVPAAVLRASAPRALRHEVPSDLWLRVNLWNRSGDPREGVGAVTRGLMPFVGREIELLPAPLSPAEAAARVIGLAEHLIPRGLVVRDGDTVGAAPGERLRAAYRERGQRTERPVIELSAG